MVSRPLAQGLTPSPSRDAQDCGYHTIVSVPRSQEASTSSAPRLWVTFALAIGLCLLVVLGILASDEGLADRVSILSTPLTTRATKSTPWQPNRVGFGVPRGIPSTAPPMTHVPIHASNPLGHKYPSLQPHAMSVSTSQRDASGFAERVGRASSKPSFGQGILFAGAATGLLSLGMITMARTRTVANASNSQASTSLADIPKTNKIQPNSVEDVVRRVAIIGGGPGGLTTAIALGQLPPTHRPTQIDIFESRDDPSTAGMGGGIQVNGGAEILNRLGLGSAVAASMNPIKRIHTRLMNGETILQVDIPEAVKRFGPFTSQLVIPEGDGIWSYSVMRDELQRILLDALPTDLATMHTAKQLVNLEDDKDMDGVMCHFKDGTMSGPYDLIVGADGVQSSARQYTNPDPSTVRYSGIRIQFGVAPSGTNFRPKNSEDELHQWFGEGAYVLTGTYGERGGARREGCVLVFESAEDAAQGENAGWTTTQIKEDFSKRLEEAGAPQHIKDMVMGCERFIETGVRYQAPGQPWSLTPQDLDLMETSKGTLQAGHVVLVGDAAHAMPPFLGQGANQGIQDAYCLANMLGTIQGTTTTRTNAIKKYEKIRKFPVFILLLQSRFLGWLETGSGLRASLRNFVFTWTGKLGVAAAVFLNGAVPRVGNTVTLDVNYTGNTETRENDEIPIDAETPMNMQAFREAQSAWKALEYIQARQKVWAVKNSWESLKISAEDFDMLYQGDPDRVPINDLEESAYKDGRVISAFFDNMAPEATNNTDQKRSGNSERRGE